MSNTEAGITVALPENPMVQFGDFHFGDNQQEFKLERAMLLGWVTNTYWETNFRTHQPGSVHARYRICPHAGGFDPIAAQRCGLEAAHHQPLLQHLGEPAEKELFPESDALLRLPETLDPDLPIFTLHVKPARKEHGLIVKLYNAGDVPQAGRIASGGLKITAAHGCDLMENPTCTLPVLDGAVGVEIPPHQVYTVLLSIHPGGTVK